MTKPFSVQGAPYESVQNRQLYMYGLARQRGASIVNSEYNAKTFTVNGLIYGDTSSDLDDHIDEFNELISRPSRNLDIVHGAGWRRYVATASKITFGARNITIIPYTVEFTVPSGIGSDIGTTDTTVSGIAVLSDTKTLPVLGSVQPKMRTTIDITAAVGLTKLEFLCNGDKLTLTTTIAAGDEIIIDENTLKVTKNGSEMPYTGIFPYFGVGANVYSIQFTGTSVTYTSTLSYLKTYL